MGNLLEAAYKPEKILKQRMKFLGLSQHDVAKQVGVKQPMISGYIRGEYPLNYDMAEKLGRVLEIDPVTLWVLHSLGNREDLGGDLKAYSALMALASVCHGLIQQADKEVRQQIGPKEQ